MTYSSDELSEAHPIKRSTMVQLSKGAWLVLIALLVSFPVPAAGQVELSPSFDTESVPRKGPTFELSALFSPTTGFVKDVAWLNEDEFLSLVVTPEGASVWKYSYSLSTKEKFISSQFCENNICAKQWTDRLAMALSPDKHYLFFNWFLDDGSYDWRLIDISSPPSFRLKRFQPPSGMQIKEALFSPDDRYIVLVHDSFQEGSEVSLLVIDLVQGSEHWRVPSSQLGFIERLWWGGAVYDVPRFSAVASLYGGEFATAAGVADLNINERSVVFGHDTAGVMFGSDALWGSVTCRQSGTPESPSFVMEADVPGQLSGQQITLSAQPVAAHCLPEPGLVLLANTEDWTQDQLWIINVITGEKQRIDQGITCLTFDVSRGGKLLVRTAMRNEIRIYELIRPGEGY